MANENVVDELVVKLRLDAEEYDSVQDEVDARASGTEKKEKQKEANRKGRERDQSSRMKGLTSTAKSLGVQLAAVAGFVAAIGAAVVGSLSGLNTFELGLRRQSVATGMSNREMQAWGSTARRLGADADAGAQSIADLAREQKQYNLTGDAPTMQALARIGVRVGANVPVQDMLGQAQDIYRRSAPTQRGQIEAQLSAQGVSADLIVMIKSETDAREAYAKSLSQGIDENKKALADFNDALASAKDNALSIANSLATVLAPGIKMAAEWFGTAATKASEFSSRITAAGGGVDGLLKVLNEDSPLVGTAIKKMADIVDVVTFGLSKLWEVLQKFGNMGGYADQFNNRVAAEVAKPDHNPGWGILNSLQNVGRYIKGKAGDVWDGAVDNAHADGFNVLGGGSGGTPTAGNANAVMGTLISKYGKTVPEAAAITASLQAESGLNPAAFNAAGGGQGAMGLAQWRGSRIDAFRSKYGITPDKATIDQQLEFMMTDPTERALLNKSLAGAGTAATQGSAVSRIYEAHGVLSEDARRGALASQLEQQYSSQGGAGGAPAVQISGPVTVVANNPNELVQGIQRQTGTTNYNSAVR